MICLRVESGMATDSKGLLWLCHFLLGACLVDSFRLSGLLCICIVDSALVWLKLFLISFFQSSYILYVFFSYLCDLYSGACCHPNESVIMYFL